MKTNSIKDSGTKANNHTIEEVIDFVCLGSKITAIGDCYGRLIQDNKNLFSFCKPTKHLEDIKHQDLPNKHNWSPPIRF